ncbi:hypothetical protein Ddye_004863 [Dipteronia dyeriana]|uniref:Protein FAR1-RELATED SEQUENCE n=1 Tax=Dipteronia dyeriana TaxID=168575 RepID=A0AAE0CP26_9ROSI|nr:hypothetical protein Ddye_004863 [Dipteronia dyeriana]
MLSHFTINTPRLLGLAPGMMKRDMIANVLLQDKGGYALSKVGVKTAQVMDHRVVEASSYSNVGHTKKDLHNRFDSVYRNKLQSSDVDCVISYLTVKHVIDPEFFFKYTLDEDDRFSNLFWADSMSRSDYGYLGDVLAF